MNNAPFAARVLALVEEIPMPTRRSTRIITCTRCGQQARHEAHGLCHRCYMADRQGTGVKDAIGRLLPIPPMVRCAGAPGLRCDRAARADVGRCWRCQQEAARAGVAA